MTTYYVDDYAGSGVEGCGLAEFPTLEAAQDYLRRKHGELGEHISIDADREGLALVEVRDNGTCDGWSAIYRDIPPYFAADYFAIGQPVTYSGYPGRILGHYCEGMWRVRLASGVVCVSGADLLAVCPHCAGNGLEMPCAYPSEGMQRCLTPTAHSNP